MDQLDECEIRNISLTFAGEAISGIIAAHPGWIDQPEIIAKKAYRIGEELAALYALDE